MVPAWKQHQQDTPAVEVVRCVTIVPVLLAMVLLLLANVLATVLALRVKLLLPYLLRP